MGEPFELKIHTSVFTWIDYLLFATVILVSCSGGLWYSALGSSNAKVKDIKDYLLGGKDLSTFPVSLSLIASYFSGVTMLGTPTEIYNYGTQYGLVVVAVACSALTVMFLYVPVFHSLKLSSSYEYLELRFNKHVRTAAATLFMFDEMLFLPMVVYVPALAFESMTGMGVYYVAGSMVIICGLYTVLGGLRAVVWTDSIQTGIMYVGMIITAFAGVASAGGFGAIWRINYDSNKLILNNWEFSPYERHSGWAVVFGQYLYWTCFNSVNQTMVQRYLSLSSVKKTRIAIIWFCVGAWLAIALCVWIGLLAWAVWSRTGCHPSAKPPVSDRLLPALVTFIARQENMRGLPGVFLAGVFGAGLSSLSAVLNACALVGVEDLCRSTFGLRLKPLHEGLLARGISTTLAVLSLLMIMVIRRLGGILSVMTTLSAIAASTSCGVFTMGMLFWWVGARGALCGAVAGALVAGTLAAGTSAASAAGYTFPPLPVTESMCAGAANLTFTPRLSGEEVFPLFRISYHWIAPLGLLSTLLVGAVAGYFLDRDKPPTHPALLSRYVHRWLPDGSWQLSPMLRRKGHEDVSAQALLLGVVAKASKDKLHHSGETRRGSGSTTASVQVASKPASPPPAPAQSPPAQPPTSQPPTPPQKKRKWRR